MNNYEFKATNLIAETFEEHDVKFDVVSHNGNELLQAGFAVDCGPNVIMRFISCDNDNDVAARIYGLISKTPKDKRFRIMEACNELNNKIRYLKFCIDTDGNINVEYDFPLETPDNGIGEMAFEIFVRTMQILHSEFNIFMKALFSDEELDTKKNPFSADLFQKLQALRNLMENPMVITEYSDEDENSDDIEQETKAFDSLDGIAS